MAQKFPARYVSVNKCITLSSAFLIWFRNGFLPGENSGQILTWIRTIVVWLSWLFSLPHATTLTDETSLKLLYREDLSYSYRRFPIREFPASKPVTQRSCPAIILWNPGKEILAQPHTEQHLLEMPPSWKWSTGSLLVPVWCWRAIEGFYARTSCNRIGLWKDLPACHVEAGPELHHAGSRKSRLRDQQAGHGVISVRGGEGLN